MKKKKGYFFLILTLLVLMIWCNAYASTLAGDKVQGKTEIMEKAFGMQLPFIANQGQINKDVSFYARTFGGTLFVTGKGEMVYSLPRISKGNTSEKITGDKKIDVWVLKESLVGSRPLKPEGVDRADTQISYFKGKDPKKWRSHIPTYNRLSLGRIYDGITLSLKARGKNVEKIFTVLPGGTVGDIRVKIDGADSLRVAQKGDLEVQTDLGPVRFSAPLAYQVIDGTQRVVKVGYDIKDNTYGFRVAEYDQNHPLIIDPLLASTFIGGGLTDWAYAAVLDSFNNIYITGYTESSDFPTTTTYGGYWGTGIGWTGPPPDDWGYDVFVVKLSSDFTSLLAATYIGGSGANEYGLSIALNSSESNVFITGTTDSDDFPTGETHSGRYDAFVCRLNNNFSALESSTLIGGSGHDTAYSIAIKSIDGYDRVYISGYTSSSDFPTTTGAYSGEYNGGADVFVARFNNVLLLEESTFVGGGANDHGFAITVDASNDVWVSGWTESSDFPVTAGAYDELSNGGKDVFIARLNSDLRELEAATYIGGAGDEKANDIKVAPSGMIYIAGYTDSENFPTTPGVYADSSGYGDDVFISMFSSDLTNLSASTYLGGAGNDEAHEITFDPSGNVYLVGETTSQDFPTTTGAYDRIFNLGGTGSDAFVSKLNSDLTELSISTFLGEIAYDGAVAVALDGVNNVYVVGSTDSDNFPVTSGAYDQTWHGYYDLFVSKLDADLSYGVTPPVVTSTTPAADATGVAVDASIYAEFSTGMDPATITTATFFVNDGTTDIPGLVSYEGTTARFSPAVHLDYSHTYTVRITINVTDLAGTPMAHECIWTFQTFVLGNNPPDKPTLVSPVNKADNVSLTTQLQAGDFFDPDSGNTHLQTRWQISRLLDFSLLVLDVTVPSPQRIFLTMPESLLGEGTTYYWRAMFFDNLESGSEWADPYRFTTGDTCTDSDGDGIEDDADNCVDDFNAEQLNADTDSIGDVCDNCPNICNSYQIDADGDNIGDVCDDTPGCGGCGQPECEKSCDYPGDDYCTENNPCSEGEGDCDGDSQCASGLICAQDVGANYGWNPLVDVCEGFNDYPGDDYCTENNPCSEGEGDCDGDSECASGLVCAQDVGANYGWNPLVDVCEDFDDYPGDDYCAEYGPCSEGEGDCDSDSECASGLICAQDVGANYGWSSLVDVCELPNGHPDYCAEYGPCSEGEGDCDGDSECASGLICAQDVGADYGWSSLTDVCEN